MLADPFASADDAESCPLVQPKAGRVLREDPGLDRPYARRLGGLREPLEQGEPDAAALQRRVDVDAVLDDTGVDAAVRHSDDCNPAGDLVVDERNEPVLGGMAAIPVVPLGSRGFERGVPGVDPCLVDAPDGLPVVGRHRHDANVRVG